jgi:NADPH:quinone reductase-like Zn-dependent oxidoreductase
MPTNSAAWITEPKGNPLEVKPAPTHVPLSNEILIRNRAVALNHIDATLQDTALFPLNYPTILGQDTAGEVAAVGPDVTRFKIGDRVLGHATAYATPDSRDGTFQEYTIIRANLASKLPDKMPFEEACVIPVGLSTAACALFQDLGLNVPTTIHPTSTPTKVVLIWGGSSSVGCNAIQLCVAAGYEVFTTTSPLYFGSAQNLGASQVFDYHDTTIVEDLVKALAGKSLAGAFDAIGSAAAVTTAEVVRQCKGSKTVVTTLPIPADMPKDVSAKHVRGDDLRSTSLGEAIYEKFLPQALEAGTFIPAPIPNIVGEGLGDLQSGLDVLRGGVSREKLVVIFP